MAFFEVATFALLVSIASLSCISQCMEVSKHGLYYDPKKEILDRIEKLEQEVVSEIRKTNTCTKQYINAIVPPF